MVAHQPEVREPPDKNSMWRKRQVVATKTRTGQKDIEEEMSSWRWAVKNSRVWDLSEKETETGMPRKAVLLGRKFNLV